MSTVKICHVARKEFQNWALPDTISSLFESSPSSINSYHRFSMSNLPSLNATEVTALLAALSDGDAVALAKLLPLKQGELHRLAHRYMSHEHKDHALQTTALVNEAYLSLAKRN